MQLLPLFIAFEESLFQLTELIEDFLTILKAQSVSTRFIIKINDIYEWIVAEAREYRPKLDCSAAHR